MINDKMQLVVDFAEANELVFDEIIDEVDQRIDQIVDFSELNVNPKVLKIVMIDRLIEKLKYLQPV